MFNRILSMKRRVFVNSLFLIFSVTIGAQSFSKIIETFNSDATDNATGIAVADYDNDGDLDVFIVARAAFDPLNPKTWNRLYEKTHTGYVDVTHSSMLSNDQYDGQGKLLMEGIKMGASWGDYDNDGYPDLFLTNQGPDQLWHNNGDGTFENVTALAGVSGPDDRYSSSALWWDYDNDGDLDLYVSSWEGGGNNGFYRNDGNTVFTDISEKTKLDNVRGSTWTSIPFDLNKDGLLDIYLVNDFQENQMYLNMSNDEFLNVTSHYDMGDTGNGMGVDIGDYGNDGNFDVYLTNISQLRENPFYINNGNTYDNLGNELMVHDAKWGWASRFIDYDHDMDEDLYVVNQQFFESGSLEHNKFYEQVSGSFIERGRELGVDNITNSRTQEVFDYDGDGDLDILLGNWGERTFLYKNDIRNNKNWLQVRLQGTTSNRNAYGAVVRIKTPDGILQHRLNHGVNYLSQSIKPIHFGLADNTIIEELTIFWPTGRIEKVSNLNVNQVYVFVEGEQGEAPNETYGTIPDNVVIEKETVIDKSIARRWNELLLESIRRDFARPTVHARNLFHIAIAMYDVWAAFDKEAKPFFLGNTVGNYTCNFSGIEIPDNIESARNEAISYASYRLLNHRFKKSPGAVVMLNAYNYFMTNGLGYDPDFTSTDYSSGSPAALGNYIAEQLIQFGLEDGSNEQNDYINKYYQPINDPLIVDSPGKPTLINPNNWQPLTLSTFIDQSGNEIPGSTPDFLSPEWGEVIPFALKKEQVSNHIREGKNYKIYNDPGEPVEIIREGASGLSDPYKWGFAMVSVWSSHLDPNDGVMIDISPGSIGNTKLEEFPKTFEEYQQYYNFYDGGDMGIGHDLNPVTGKSYEPQIVPRGDYARVLAEFWADGPDSETPPGHWFTILNYVSDHPLTEKKFSGKSQVLNDLEWDVKCYLSLAGAMHDCACNSMGHQRIL